MLGLIDLSGGIKGITAKNYLINGDHSFSQRGNFTSSSAIINGYYYHDRWKVDLTGVTGAKITLPASPTGIPYKSLRLIATSTNASAYLRMYQIVEYTHILDLIGKECTFSAWVKSDTANARLFVYSGFGAVNLGTTTHSGSGNWELLSVPFVMPNTGTTDSMHFFASIASSTNVATSITNGQYIEMTAAVLNEGDKPAPFTRAGGTYAQELALCQRYYEKSFEVNTPPANGATATTFAASGACQVFTPHRSPVLGSYVGLHGFKFKVPKRTSPTMAKYGNSTGQFLYSTAYNTATWSSGVSPFIQNTEGFEIGNEFDGSMNVRMWFHWTADAEF